MISPSPPMHPLPLSSLPCSFLLSQLLPYIDLHVWYFEGKELILFSPSSSPTHDSIDVHMLLQDSCGTTEEESWRILHVEVAMLKVFCSDVPNPDSSHVVKPGPMRS